MWLDWVTSNRISGDTSGITIGMEPNKSYKKANAVGHKWITM